MEPAFAEASEGILLRRERGANPAERETEWRMG
jgi:hypothetical protein